MLLWLPSALFALPDLTIQSSDISFSDSNAESGVSFQIQAVVRNTGSAYHNQVVSEPVIYQSTAGAILSTSPVRSALWYGQRLTPNSTFHLARVDIPIYDTGDPNDIARVQIRRETGGSPSNSSSDVLSTGTVNTAIVDPSEPIYERFDLDAPVSLASGTTYWLPLESDASSDNGYDIWYTTFAGTSELKTSTNRGSTWNSPTPASRTFFKLYRPQDTVVKFYLGDPGNNVVLGVSTISLSVPAGGSTTVSISTALAAGTYDIYAVVDETGLINESDETTNNRSSRSLTVLERQTSGQRTTITASDGKTQVVLEPGAVPLSSYFISIDASPAPNAAVQAANDKADRDKDAFRFAIPSTLRKVTFYDGANISTPVESVSFAGDVTLTIPYTDNGRGYVAGANPPVQERHLSVYWLNERDGLWLRLPTSRVDTTNNTVSARVPHFSYFILMGMNAEDLSQAYAYPVPFRPSKGHTRVKFAGLSPQCVIRVYSLSGELIKTIQESDGDSFNDSWDGSGAASGTYIYVIENGSERKTGQLVIVK
jgi:hypothetical protein